MKVLILDDDATRHDLFRSNFISHELTHVYTVDQAISELKRCVYGAVCLDHDLGGQQMVESEGSELTGYDVAKWLVDNPERVPENVFIHSLNPVGAQNIKRLLPNSIIAPGLWTVKN